MQSYNVFGGCLASEIPLSELSPCSGRPDWSLRVVRSVSPAPEEELLGEETVNGSVFVRLFRHAGGYRLVYDNTGVFDITHDGARIDWRPATGAALESVSFDVLRRVLPLTLHLSGVLCVHGSAVTIDGNGIAFLAPKSLDKSILTEALVAEGASPLTEGLVAIEPGPPASVRAKVPRLPLQDNATDESASEKKALGGVEESSESVPNGTTSERVPLSASYVLAPVPAGPGKPLVKRRRVEPVLATFAILSHTRFGALLGTDGATLLRDRVRSVSDSGARRYELYVEATPKGSAEVVRRLREWHGGSFVGAGA